MGRRKRKQKEHQQPAAQSKSNKPAFDSLESALSDRQVKKIVFAVIFGLALPFLAFFLSAGNTDALYVTILLTGSLAILTWALPDLKLGLTGVFLFTQPLLILLANTDYNYTKSIYSLLFIGLLGILWGVDWLRKREVEISFSRLLWVGLALIGIAMLSLINSRVILANVHHIVYLLYFAFFYLFLVNAIKREPDLKLLLRVILIAGVWTSIYALLQYFDLVLGKPGAEGGSPAVISSFGNKNYMAGFLSYLFVPGLLLLYRSTTLWDRLFAMGALSLFTLALLTATSESAWLGLLLSLALFGILLWATDEIKNLHAKIGLGILFSVQLLGAVLLFLILSAVFIYDSPLFLSSMGQAYSSFSTPTWIVVVMLVLFPAFAWAAHLMKTRYQRMTWIGVGVAFVLAIGFVFTPPGAELVGDLAKFLRKNTFQTRIQDWWIGYAMFENNPIVGTAVGDYKREFIEYKDEFMASPRAEQFDRYIPRAAQAHNEYVQILAEMGILGALATLAFIVMLIWTLISRLRSSVSSEVKWLSIGLFAGIVAFMADAFFSFPLHLPGNVLALVFLLGALNSRALGGEGVSVKLPRGAAIGLFAAIFIFISAVSVFAYRDWRGDLAMDRGRYLYQVERDLDAAGQKLQESTEFLFAAGEAYYWLGIIHYEQSQSATSDNERRALRAESKDYFLRSMGPFLNESTYFYLAVIEQENMNYEESLEYVNQLLALDPTPSLMPDILQLEAVNIYNLGDVEEGISKLETLADAHPREPAMNLTLARMYQEQWVTQNDDSYCELGREAIREAQSYVQMRLDRLDELLNPQEDTNITYNRYFSWQSEKSSLEGIQSQFSQLLLSLRC